MDRNSTWNKRNLLRKQRIKARKCLPRAAGWQLVAYILATSMYLLSVVLFIAGAWMVSYLSVISVMVGILLIGATAWSLSVSFQTMTTKDQLVRPSDFPTLFNLIKQIADRQHVPMPDVYIDNRFDASFAKLGWSGTPTIRLGYPMLALLNPTELITVLAHELAHSDDGAMTRSLYVRVAQMSLIRWHCLFRGVRIGRVEPFYLLRRATSLLIHILSHCTGRDLQRAELVADQVAIEISANQNPEQLLQKMMYYCAIDTTFVQRNTHTVASIQNAVTRIPVHQWASFWAAVMQKTTQPTDTHPSMSTRLAAMQQVSISQPLVTLSDEDFSKFQSELSVWMES